MKLDEIVVTGYGTSKKKDITGSLVTLKADDLNQTGAITPEQMFQGKVSGVQIVANNGEPGAGMQIKIRGASSIRSGQQPLYDIDEFLLICNLHLRMELMEMHWEELLQQVR